ncbi:HIT-like protein [Wilcoxina mikolae CBS 423.85]|nr:HIT-like protein [Wilcoxina mikolae CBS 423.85]
MPPPLTPLYFSKFPITSQLFHLTPLSFAIVNLKPLLPGHILVCPQRVVPRIHDLRPDEITDLFLTVQKLGSAIEKIYKAEGINIAIQDGAAAGQSVPHVHAHIIPRHTNDLPEDEIYRLLESDEADLARAHGEMKGGDTPSTGQLKKGLVPKPDAERTPRSEEEMRKEAEWLARKIKELEM